MNEIIFLGLTKAQWELINSFSNWLSAIGTIAAVVVSLWLATKASRLQCNAQVGHRIVIEQGSHGTYPEILVFRIVNTGERPFQVNSVGWRVGIFRWRREAMQFYDQAQSSPMPVELQHGQEAKWVVPMLSEEKGWFKTFPTKMLSPHPHFYCATLRAMFVTSIGKTFVVKPEPGLLSKLRAATAAK
jgi:hypothetical protein